MASASRRCLLSAAVSLPVLAVVAACTSGGDHPSGAARSSPPSGTPSSPAAHPSGSHPSGSHPSGSESSGSGSYVLHRDLAYAEPVGRAHLLDVYVPTTGSGPFPVVVYQAGSAWMSDDTKGGPGDGPSGDQSGGTQSGETGLDGSLGALTLAREWTPRGWAVVGLNVRSSAQAHFPAQVHDVKAAIRYLRVHAGELLLDSARIATMGTSSGGWVATMAGVTAGVADLEGDLGNPGVSSAVRAVVDLFGPTDFLQMDAERLPDGVRHDPPDSPESQLMGFPIQSDPGAVHAADPRTYVGAGSPPIWISHGLADPQVPHQQSQLLFASYEQARAQATLTLVPGAGHTAQYLASDRDSPGRSVQVTSSGRTTTTDRPAPTYDAIFAFLQQHLA